LLILVIIQAKDAGTAGIGLFVVRWRATSSLRIV
jgi:hypothetical protein